MADGLRDGSLRVVVSTSALELGVDLPRVTRVILLGAPSSLLRATQAAGRADHRPGVPATAAVLPLSALDLLRACAARDALARGEADEVALAAGDLDVAAQAALGRVALGPCADADPRAPTSAPRRPSTTSTTATSTTCWTFSARAATPSRPTPRCRASRAPRGTSRSPAAARWCATSAAWAPS